MTDQEFVELPDKPLSTGETHVEMTGETPEEGQSKTVAKATVTHQDRRIHSTFTLNREDTDNPRLIIETARHVGGIRVPDSQDGWELDVAPTESGWRVVENGGDIDSCINRTSDRHAEYVAQASDEDFKN